MFLDEPRFILPLEPGDRLTFSWDTRGPIEGPFLSPIYSQHSVSNRTRRWFEKRIEWLEDYLPFDVRVKKDNRPAYIQLTVANNAIQPEGLELERGQYVAGMILPQGSYHRIVFRTATTFLFSSKRTIFHEVGHALGLTHPGTGGFDEAYTTADTIMSYNVTDPRPWFRPLDLVRMQELWGHDSKDLDPITGLPFR